MLNNERGDMTEEKLVTQYNVNGGVLDGTIIEPMGSFVSVKYPHRKTKDLYVTPIKDAEKWHCCQDNCPEPDFGSREIKVSVLIEHLKLHAGRLLKKRV